MLNFVIFLGALTASQGKVFVTLSCTAGVLRGAIFGERRFPNGASDSRSSEILA